MKLCPRCGTRNIDNSIFCMKCGMRFTAHPQDNAPPHAPSSESLPYSSQSSYGAYQGAPFPKTTPTDTTRLSSPATPAGRTKPPNKVHPKSSATSTGSSTVLAQRIMLFASIASVGLSSFFALLPWLHLNALLNLGISLASPTSSSTPNFSLPTARSICTGIVSFLENYTQNSGSSYSYLKGLSSLVLNPIISSINNVVLKLDILAIIIAIALLMAFVGTAQMVKTNGRHPYFLIASGIALCLSSISWFFIIDDINSSLRSALRYIPLMSDTTTFSVTIWAILCAITGGLATILAALSWVFARLDKST